MPYKLDARVLRPHERIEAMNHVIWNSVVRVQIDYSPAAERLSAQLTLAEVGPFSVFGARTNATGAHRTPKLVGADEPMIFINVQRTGFGVISQDGREARLERGDMAIFDTSRPYSLVYPQGADVVTYRIRPADLRMPMASVELATARTIRPDEPLGEALGGFFAEQTARLARNDNAPALVGGGIDLLRATIARVNSDPAVRARVLEETIESRILAYINTHLRDSRLTPGRIAAAHHISRRQLYLVLARAGIELGDYLRLRRLEACREDLSKPDAGAQTIAAVAHYWGFTNASHFSRAFRDLYGISPREWRSRALYLHAHAAGVDEGCA